MKRGSFVNYCVCESSFCEIDEPKRQPTLHSNSQRVNLLIREYSPDAFHDGEDAEIVIDLENQGLDRIKDEELKSDAKVAYLSANQLSSLPLGFSGLKAIKELHLRGNLLTEIPPVVRDMSTLEVLNLAKNDLQFLPEWLYELKNLKELCLHGNDALGIPPEILGSFLAIEARNNKLKRKPIEILDYYFRQTGRRRLNEAKLILVGQGGVGKTSLVRRLLENRFDENESKTEGIAVAETKIPARHEGEEVRVNIWDFGGQEVMHATHQFFLTKRSVYIVVIDGRSGDQEGNLHYWLEMVKVYGGESPVFVVVNKTDQHQEELNERRIVLDHSDSIQFAGFHYVSCLTGEGLKELWESLNPMLRDLPHVSDWLPNDFFSVKQELEGLKKDRDFISREEYDSICQQLGVNDEIDRERLLRFLHDLGCVLNYDDDEQIYSFRDTNVLNPKWVTDGVYSLLNNPDLLRKANGICERGDLQALLWGMHNGQARYPRERLQFLVDMLQRFELSFPLNGRQSRILIPQLLSTNEPDVGWIESTLPFEKLVDFRYTYRVLPSGLVPRFIVRAHHHLSDKATYWRHGCVLQCEGCRVLVRGDPRRAVVFVQVQGDFVNARRRALARVREIFAEVHIAYGDIGAEAKVPVPGFPNAPAVDYDYLVQLEKDGVKLHRFEKVDRSYLIADLLDGVDPDRVVEAFICFNMNDLSVVRGLREKLQRSGVRCWFSADDSKPGSVWVEEFAKTIRNCKSIVVALGPSGFGEWQELQSQMGLVYQHQGQKNVIPVVLPGGDVDSNNWPDSVAFLKTRTVADLTDEDDHRYQLERLVSAIRQTTKRPDV